MAILSGARAACVTTVKVSTAPLSIVSQRSQIRAPAEIIGLLPFESKPGCYRDAANILIAVGTEQAGISRANAYTLGGLPVDIERWT